MSAALISTSTDALAAAIPAWRSSKAWLWLAVFVALGLVTDLSSKWLAFRYVADAPVVVSRERVLAAARPGDTIPPHEPIVVVPKALNFTLVLNPGAVFGMGAGKRWFFIGFTFVAIIAALWVFGTWTTSTARVSHLAVALLLSGGVGNLYDRVVYGCVRDFIHPLPGVVLPFGWFWPWGGREVWPYVSNIADLWLIIGMMILIITSRGGVAKTASNIAGGPQGSA